MDANRFVARSIAIASLLGVAAALAACGGAPTHCPATPPDRDDGAESFAWVPVATSHPSPPLVCGYQVDGGAEIECTSHGDGTWTCAPIDAGAGDAG